MNKKPAKKDKKKTKKITCIDCGVKTDDYYSSSINSGKIFRCVNCHETWIVRSTRYESRITGLDEK